ncbi:FecR domain-containing protein [Methyloversatilis discipulorum]|uniref:FecR domain-containing protein n=1 Tax=Methyloversatilis discipulorum TaxID=1119528 RepID=UPI001A42B21F|nr:FecR domain-containing protein [Methyloversatilis discipulorum]MBL8469106.1 FecR domain-containing protein [Methyloversatilis discipulorum]
MSHSASTAAQHERATEDGTPSAAVVAAATEWYLKMQDDACTPEQRSALHDWLQADPMHRLAYGRIDSIWSRFGQVDARAGKAALDASLAGSGRRRRALAGALMLACTVAGSGWLALQSQTARYLLADHRTAPGERLTITLDDGSRITLNTDSAIDAQYTGQERRIVLRRGEILVEVSTDPQRPFVVESRHATARALGTQYLVRDDADATRVAVIESTVEACSRAVGTCTTLAPGSATRITEQGVGATEAADIDALIGWRDGVLAVDDKPLTEVLAELERYRRGTLYYDPEALQGLSVSGVFPLDDTDRALAALSANLPLRITRFTSYVVRIERR